MHMVVFLLTLDLHICIIQFNAPEKSFYALRVLDIKFKLRLHIESSHYFIQINYSPS